MLHTPGTISKNDPIVDSVRSVMRENDVRRTVETQYNQELGIASSKQLPSERVPDYKLQLETRVQTALKGPVNEETINELSPEKMGAYFAKAQTTEKKTGDSYKRVEGRRLAREKVTKKTGKDVMHYAYPNKEKPQEEQVKDHLEQMKKQKPYLDELRRRMKENGWKNGKKVQESTLDEKVTNAQTAALTNKITAGMTKKQADRLNVGDKVNVDGSNYTATKGDSRWRIANRHLRAGEAQSRTRNKDDDASAPAPKASTAGTNTVQGKAPPAMGRGSTTYNQAASGNRDRSKPRVAVRPGVAGSLPAAKPQVATNKAPATASVTGRKPSGPNLNTTLISKAATSRQAQTGDRTLVSRNIKKPSASTILGRGVAPSRAPTTSNRVRTSSIKPNSTRPIPGSTPIRPATGGFTK